MLFDSRYRLINTAIKTRLLPVWQMLIYLLPFFLTISGALGAYLLLNNLYGDNVFTVGGHLLLVVPPSTWASGISVTGAATIWALTLLLTAVALRRRAATE